MIWEPFVGYHTHVYEKTMSNTIKISILAVIDDTFFILRAAYTVECSLLLQVDIPIRPNMFRKPLEVIVQLPACVCSYRCLCTSNNKYTGYH